MNLVAGYTRAQADKDMSAALGGLIEAFRYGDDAAIAGFAAVARKTLSGRLRVLVNTATGDQFHSPLPLYAEKVPADVFQVVEQEVERAMAWGWSTIQYIVYTAQLLAARLPEWFTSAPPEGLLLPRRYRRGRQPTPVESRFLREGIRMQRLEQFTSRGIVESACVAMGMDRKQVRNMMTTIDKRAKSQAGRPLPKPSQRNEEAFRGALEVYMRRWGMS